MYEAVTIHQLTGDRGRCGFEQMGVVTEARG